MSSHPVSDSLDGAEVNAGYAGLPPRLCQEVGARRVRELSAAKSSACWAAKSELRAQLPDPRASPFAPSRVCHTSGAPHFIDSW